MPRTMPPSLQKTKHSASDLAKDFAQMKRDFDALRKELVGLRKAVASGDTMPGRAGPLIERLDAFEDSLDAQEAATVILDKTDAVIPWKEAKRKLGLA